MKIKLNLWILIFTFLLTACSETTSEEEGELFDNGGGDPIEGQWFLITINDTDVSNLDCYQESYIRSDGQTIEFYLLDLLQDGSCELVVDSSENLSIQEGFYYIGDEAIEIYIEGRKLTWRVNFDSTLIFEKS
ncbi:hypothetical protein [Croceivirga thetidis]|uniref:Lipocalin-like domain-containing protein n=1 Tax=Croceivirga thetidis TaxID=2721623 RepID=A0ABX1GVN9_9FLAO|nr:hypothetical protein [Croceivirga thetidis]NKI33101.1 hypothetical protein [Croceivirga thetidis]